MRVMLWVPALCLLGCEAEDKDDRPCPPGYEEPSPGLCLPTADTGDSTPQDTAAPEPDTGEPEPGETVVPGDDLDPPILGMELPGSCAAPSDIPADPIEDRGSLDTTMDGGEVMKMIDLSADPGHGVIWGVGAGGLVPFNVSDPDAPVRMPSYPGGEEEALFHHVLALQEEDEGHGLVYTTHWVNGLTVIDGTDPGALEWVGEQGGFDLGDMTQVDDRLYVVNHGGAIQVYDITNRSSPAPAGSVSGLGTPWRLTATESAVYVADALEGLVTLDRTDPDHPIVTDTIPVPGIQDVDSSEDLLVAAAGVNGVILYDLTLPLQPKKIGQLKYGSAVVRVHLDGELLWLVDHQSVRVIDITEPLKAQPIASRATPHWAVDVTTVDGTAWVADWSALSGYSADDDANAPDITLELDEVLIHPDGESISMSIRNMGRTTLELTGAQTELSELEVRVSADQIGPRGTERIRLHWPGGEIDDQELCLSSNDPDTPVIHIPLQSGGGGTNPLVGTEAPDFILTGIDLEGVSGGGPVPATFSQRLIDQRGQPIVLVFFSPHDLLSPLELLEIEHNIWQKYQAAGVTVWGISADEPPDMALFWITMGLSFPLFPDPDADVQTTYPMERPFSTAEYPQEWVVDAAGTIIYAGSMLNPGALQATVDRALE